MAPSRAYVPSRALLRALARPQPPRCPLARSITTPFHREKRTKAAATAQVEKARKSPLSLKQVTEIVDSAEAKFKDEDWIKEAERPLSDQELEDPDIPVISWYEQDVVKGTSRRLISRLATPEDRKKDAQMHRMIEESYKNPNYDDAELNKRLIDSLISNPNFADLTEELMEMKEEIKTKEELAVLDAEAAKEAEQDTKELNANLRMTTHQALQDLINDPDAGVAKDELQAVLDRMPEVEDIDNPEFQAVLQKAMTKLNDDPRFQKKMASMADTETDAAFEKEWADFEKEVDETIDEVESDDSDLAPLSEDDIHDVDQLLTQMRDVIKSIGGDSKLEAELDAVLNEDPDADQDGVFEREMDFEELAEEIKKLAEKKAPLAKEAEPEETVPADLQAKVDKIMEDPKLMEKLVYIQKLIEESDRAKSELTAIAHETAPDPYELEGSRTATVKQRMQAAREDPVHTAALDRLRVKLLPPFNISPALKSFNQAIELAYIGANDDIRRILWRSYQRARTLPTFLQNLSDEAWDILYYSQAVTWGSNQNREDHLRMMLADLKSLGRDGPPTHPSSLVSSGDGKHLDVEVV